MELADLHVDTPLCQSPVISKSSLAEFEKVLINFAFCFLPSSVLPPQALRQPLTAFYRPTQRAKLNSMDNFISIVDDLHPNLDPLFSLEGLEDFTKIEDVIQIIDKYPVSILSFSWNNDNPFASGCFGEGGAGLTEMGKELLSELEKRKIVLDISHASPELSRDLLKSSNLVIATHSNAVDVYDHPRNLADWQIRAIAEKDGVVGLNIYRKFLGAEGSMEDFLFHLEHIIKIGGEHVVALGSDFDGMSDGIISSPLEYYLLFERVSSAFSKDLAMGVFYQNARNCLSCNS